MGFANKVIRRPLRRNARNSLESGKSAASVVLVQGTRVAMYGFMTSSDSMGTNTPEHEVNNETSQHENEQSQSLNRNIF